MKVLILRLAAAKSCRASEAEVDFIGHITPLSLVFRDGDPVWIPLIEDLTISYDHCVVEPRLTRRLVEICSFREYPPTCRRRERDLLTTARRNECVSPFVASSVVHEDRRRPGWLQSASLISRARPATPGARARYTFGPRARTHATASQNREALKPGQRAVTIPSVGKRRRGFRGSTPTTLRAEAPGKRAHRRDRAVSIYQFVCVLTADIHFDINRGEQPRPSAHNGVVPIRTVMAPLRIGMAVWSARLQFMSELFFACKKAVEETKEVVTRNAFQLGRNGSRSRFHKELRIGLSCNDGRPMETGLSAQYLSRDPPIESVEKLPIGRSVAAFYKRHQSHVAIVEQKHPSAFAQVREQLSKVHARIQN